MKPTHITRATGGRSSVYFARLTNGIVKIGFSDNMRSRLHSLNCQAKRRYGGVVAELNVYDGIGARCEIAGVRQTPYWRAIEIERRCIRILASLGEAIAPSTEFFRGVDYAQAKRLIDAEISAVTHQAA